MIVCLKCGLLRRIPETGEGEPWEGGPGSVMWDRGGAAYTVENLGPGKAELLLVEMKDSYAISQVRVPYSERDPMLVDAPHYRVALENEHVRVLLLHLNPREGTEESQFPSRLEIALNEFRANEEPAGEKLREVTRQSGKATWKENELKSIVNVGDKPLEEVIVELKHPFCYTALPDSSQMDKQPELKKYFEVVQTKINKFWLKRMPRSMRESDTGFVALRVKLDHDGTIREDGIGFHEVFATDALVEKSVSAVRDAGPFPPLPQSVDKPVAEIALEFLYNLPPKPPSGCHE